MTTFKSSDETGEKVDEITLKRKILQDVCMRTVTSLREDGEPQEWQNFLHEIIARYPDIPRDSMGDLERVESALYAKGYNQEALIVVRIMTEIAPDSYENQCFLGHAYKRVGDFPRAAERYLKAYEVIMKRIEELGKVKQKPLDKSHALYLDASDYLSHLAVVEAGMDNYADAFIHALQAYAIVRDARVVGFKIKEAESLLDEIRIKISQSRSLDSDNE